MCNLSQGLVETAEAKGREIERIALICRKLKKGKEPYEIAEDLDEELEVVERICEAAKEAAPEYDESEIYEALHGTVTGRAG